VGRLVVVGSINVDFVARVQRLPRPGETVTGGDFQRTGGGKGANQAVAAARLGGAVALVGAVGADDAGDGQLAELTAEGIDLSSCARLGDAATGIALIVVDAAGENQIAVASGANERLDGTAVSASLAQMPAADGDVLLTSFELPDEAVDAAVRWAATHGVASIVNPAPARAIRDSILDAHPILTPNEHEAAQLTGQADPERAARVLQSMTRAPVVVTLGSGGALLLDDEGVATRIPALEVQVVDSTGAGDTLNGILAAELARGSTLEEAVRLAVAGASLSTTRRGARAGMPTRAEIEAVLP
jgi:ribokinase